MVESNRLTNRRLVRARGGKRRDGSGKKRMLKCFSSFFLFLLELVLSIIVRAACPAEKKFFEMDEPRKYLNFQSRSQLCSNMELHKSSHPK